MPLNRHNFILPNTDFTSIVYELWEQPSYIARYVLVFACLSVIVKTFPAFIPLLQYRSYSATDWPTVKFLHDLQVIVF